MSIRNSIISIINKTWYRSKPNLISNLLKPISLIFIKIINIRKTKQKNNQYISKIPIIIVGNINIGGTGKTIVVRMLANNYLNNGKNPAIISRGYGVHIGNNPIELNKKSLAYNYGDEPVMLFNALKAKVPIIVTPNRINAVKYIEKKIPKIDIIISDDGLQHYKLARYKEIIVIDAIRMFGNKLCLPAGPLREPIERIKKANKIIVIGNCLNKDKKLLIKYKKNIIWTTIIPTKFVNLLTSKIVSKNNFYNKNIIAITGISNPKKFFNTLEINKINIIEKIIFKDHHKFTQNDFKKINKNKTIIMTYKDAIKCKNFAKLNWWYLDITLNIKNKII